MGVGTIIAAKRLQRPLLRQTTFEDYPRIAAVEAAAGLNPRSREQWERLWRTNPAYEALPDWPIGWVLEDDRGSIVGSIGNIPLFFEMNGRIHAAATYCGWAVDPKYRAYSLTLLADKMQHPSVDLQLVTTAGPMPSAVFTRMGWVRAPVGQWDRSAFWVTNHRDAFRQYLARKTPALVAKAAGPLLSAPLFVKDLVDGMRRPGRSAYELEWSHGFDGRFERFWDELRAAKPDTFLATRSLETLEWHFRPALDQDRLWILTASKGSRLEAYAIFERKDGRSVDLTRVILVDFQMLDRDAALASALIDRALDRCRRERIHVLENFGCWLAELEPIAHRPPFTRPLDAWCYMYHAKSPALARALQNPAAWYPTQFDGDASL